eukprot:6738507-Heterocapsa_arctica.AAC.1
MSGLVGDNIKDRKNTPAWYPSALHPLSGVLCSEITVRIVPFYLAPDVGEPLLLPFCLLTL